jgi:chemotaxis regulatin CheY-phosphate phosphatase CheZ
MRQGDFKILLKHIEELKALFIFSKRTVPFIEDIIYFIQEIVPVLQELASSIEVTSEKLPKASKQLSKVTHATEMASTEILNILEHSFVKIQHLQEEVQRDGTMMPGLSEKMNSTLEGIKTDNMNIMMALQVQDITSQQIASVNRLMQAVDEGLARLMKHFSDVTVGAKDDKYTQPNLDIPFDEYAEYDVSHRRQEIADEVIAQTGKAHGPRKSKHSSHIS